MKVTVLGLLLHSFSDTCIEYLLSSVLSLSLSGLVLEKSAFHLLSFNILNYSFVLKVRKNSRFLGNKSGVNKALRYTSLYRVSFIFPR